VESLREMEGDLGTSFWDRGRTIRTETREMRVKEKELVWGLNVRDLDGLQCCKKAEVDTRRILGRIGNLMHVK
jgi:hypothetical protein